jgi:hypothetical protein
MNMHAKPLRESVAGIGLASRAMLVVPSIRQWSGRKLDREVTDAAAVEFQADSDAGRFNKLLIGREHIAAIARIAGKARNETYYQTAPWLDDGARVLPAMGYERFRATMLGLQGEFNRAVCEFVRAYPRLIDESRARLGGMFKESDYPPADQIASRYGFSIRYLPIPTSGDFRLDVPGADSIRAEIATAESEIAAAASRDAARRLLESVQHMAEKLAAYQPGGNDGRAQNVFRDSLVENVRDLVEILPGLNLADSPVVTGLRELVAKHLCGNDAKTLREDSAVREKTARAASAIVAKMSEFI